MAISCSNCSKELPDNAKFCSGCGSQVAEAQVEAKPRFCAKCGVQLPEDAKFCLECGLPVTEDETPWFEKHDEAFEQEMVKYSPLFDEKNSQRKLDFEKNKSAISDRVRRWAEYDANKMSAPDWFVMLHTLNVVQHVRTPWQETHYFPTNKPNAHEALVRRTMIEYFVEEARKRGYIDYEGNYSPKVVAFLSASTKWTVEELKELRFKVDLSELDELAKKDDKLFPPPQPVMVEAPGGIILNFTTDEAVLVVYLDCIHQDKEVSLDGSFDKDSEWIHRKAKVIERKTGDNPLCAAIFNHIPFVTDDLRHYEKNIKQIKCEAKFTNDPVNIEEEVTLFRGKATPIDWRGRKE